MGKKLIKGFAIVLGCIFAMPTVLVIVIILYGLVIPIGVLVAGIVGLVRASKSEEAKDTMVAIKKKIGWDR